MSSLLIKTQRLRYITWKSEQGRHFRSFSIWRRAWCHARIENGFLIRTPTYKTYPKTITTRLLARYNVQLDYTKIPLRSRDFGTYRNKYVPVIGSLRNLSICCNLECYRSYTRKERDAFVPILLSFEACPRLCNYVD